MTTSLLHRFRSPPSDLARDLVLRRGSLKDYARLEGHHYRAHRPATATRVLVLEDPRPTPARRFLGRSTDLAPNEVVAVLVESLPSLSCRMRDHATDDRYAGIRSPRQRAAVLNAELRCISRVVVHPAWRGTGLAVRLVRHALHTATTPLTEALAAMGHVHPFFARAGMTAYHRAPHPYDRRLADALRSLGIEPLDLAYPADVLHRLDQLPTARRGWIFTELHRWYRRNAGRAARQSDQPLDHLRTAQQRLLCEPVYYLHDNRTPNR